MHTTATTRTSEITGRQQQPLLLSPLRYRQKKRGYQSILIFEKQIYIAVQAIRLAIKMRKGTKRPYGQDHFYSTGAVSSGLTSRKAEETRPNTKAHPVHRGVTT